MDKLTKIEMIITNNIEIDYYLDCESNEILTQNIDAKQTAIEILKYLDEENG